MTDIEFYGFKFLVATEIDGQIRITSPYYHQEWHRGLNTATCRGRNFYTFGYLHPADEVPSEGCTCGIYSSLHYERAVSVLLPRGALLLTLVRSYGKVLLGEKGVLRAERAAITHVVFVKHNNDLLSLETVRSMSDYLGVPQITLYEAKEIVQKKVIPHLSGVGGRVRTLGENFIIIDEASNINIGALRQVNSSLDERSENNV